MEDRLPMSARLVGSNVVAKVTLEEKQVKG